MRKALLVGTLIAAWHPFVTLRAAEMPAWSLDPAQLHIPDAPLRGRMAGRPDFAPTPSRPEGVTQTLKFVVTDERQNVYSLSITDPRLETGPALEGLKITVAPTAPALSQDPRIPTPTVTLTWGREEDDRYRGRPYPGQDIPWGRSGRDTFKGNFALIMEFGAVKEGKLPGGIYLCLPDETKTVLAGRFEMQGMTLATIKGPLMLPPVINEKVLFIGSVGAGEKEPLSANGAELDMTAEGAAPPTNHTTRGQSGVTTVVHINQKLGGDYLQRGCKPGWHLLLIGAGVRDPTPPVDRSDFPMSRFPSSMMPIIPVPRVYAAQWVELKDDRTLIDTPLRLDPSLLGSVKAVVTGTREGSILTFLPLAADGKVPLPAAHGVSPYLRIRIKNGTPTTLRLPEGKYEFMCLNVKQTVTIEPGKTKTMKMDF